MTSPVSPSETLEKAMEGVTRYANSYNSNGLGFSNGITEDQNGGYVRYDDYQALALKLEAMQREMAELRKSVRNAMGAIESNQVADKDVHGTLSRVINRLDALSGAPQHPHPGREEMKITEDRLFAACKAFSESDAVYPDGSAATQITDWFRLDAQDAVDFGVLAEPKWDGVSDIRGTQHEWYVASVIKEPMRAALTAALAVQTQHGVEEWHRSDNRPGSTLLYTLREDCSSRGKPIMGNDVMIRIERDNRSDTDIEPIVQRVLSALVDVPAVESEPVAFVSHGTLASLLNGFGGLYQLKTPKWKTEETTIPLYAHPPRSSLIQSEEGLIAKKARALASAILANYGSMEDGDGNEAPELAMARDILALPTHPSPYGGDNGDGAATGTKGVSE